MRVLLAHRFLPGQFAQVASALGADPANEVVFLYDRDQGEPAMPGVRGLRIDEPAAVTEETHPFLSQLHGQVVRGLAAYRACCDLRASGFTPDVIYAHGGSGLGLYLRDAYPDTPLLGYFEWFFSGFGSDLDFVDPAAVTDSDLLHRHTSNACVLLELVQCQEGICPTNFQRDQFPRELQAKLSVLHDGVDVDYFDPSRKHANRSLSPEGLPDDAEIVTYAARGLEPYRGFPQFMEAIAELQGRRPRLHVLIAGSERSFYSRPLPEGLTYRQMTLERLPALDLTRVHFLGFLPREEYRALLHRSWVHVYLTAPFVLSWSLIEAMAAGCAIVGSDTLPVREVLCDGANVLLADFHCPAAIAEKIAQALDDRAGARRVARAARRLAEQRFALDRLLPKLLDRLRGLASNAG